MKKKIGMWLTGFLLLCLFGGRVYAASENNVADEEANVMNEAESDAVIEAESGYCLGDELYIFFWMKDGYDAGSLSVKLESENVSSDDEGTVVPVAESSSIVRYVFMVDSSGTMCDHIDKVNAFVDSLMEEEKQEAFYTVATFGEHFEVVSENLTDKNTVKEVLAGLDYSEKLTDPYTGVENALKYLDSYSIRSGDIVNLIVITDGEPDLGIKDEDERQESEKRFAQSTADKIANAPEVIVSTLCMAEWQEYAYEAFAGSRGIHEKIDDNQDAAAAGKKMAQYVDSLYRTSLKLSGVPSVERFSVKLKMRGNSIDGQLVMLEADIEGIPNLKMFSNGAAPEAVPGKAQGEAGSVDVQESAPDFEKIENEESDCINAPGTAAEAETEDRTGTETEIETGAEDGTETEESEEKKVGKKVSLLIISIVCVFAIAGIGIVFFVKKKTPNRAKETAEAVTKPVSGGIAMKLEVYAGNCISKASTLYLVDCLRIGSSPECHIRFDDLDVEPLHSRIFKKDQMIYIEDMNSKEGTALGGMRIQGQNRLRSGDVISIGGVEFCLKF
ncbi:MAG: FHA domain-containing protein [Lachnospiraceae bacterium]|nr:FHA domain-containing protein [Lachnospiraceae bacterium]